MLHARLLTNDTALCQVARLQQVPALNLADLARALTANSWEPGTKSRSNLVKEGRERLIKGWLTLQDGTMIVVNHARQHLGKAVRVVVSSALQTCAGRLIFAELKGKQGNQSPAS